MLLGIEAGSWKQQEHRLSIRDEAEHASQQRFNSAALMNGRGEEAHDLGILCTIPTIRSAQLLSLSRPQVDSIRRLFMCSSRSFNEVSTEMNFTICARASTQNPDIQFSISVNAYDTMYPQSLVPQ